MLLQPPAPSAAPTSVSTSTDSSSSITIQWGQVDCIDRNGDITGYSVRYTGGGSTQTVNVSRDFSGGIYVISNLEPSTNYSIGVAAMNGELIGPYSTAVNQLTEGNILLAACLALQLCPLLPVSALVLKVDSVTATSISLFWNSTGSEALNYDIHWEINTSVGCPEVSDFNYTLNVGFTNYTITGVEENSNYYVHGEAINEVSLTYDMVTVMTLEAGKRELEPLLAVMSYSLSSSSICCSE